MTVGPPLASIALDLVACAGDGPVVVNGSGRLEMAAELRSLGVEAFAVDDRRGDPVDQETSRSFASGGGSASLRRRATAAWVGTLDPADAGAIASLAADARAFGRERLFIAVLRPQHASQAALPDARAWDAAVIGAGFRRSPRHLLAASRRSDGELFRGVFDRMSDDEPSNPAASATDLARSTTTLATGVLDLYQWASGYIRPGDRVLVLNCGGGGGAALLAHNSLCSEVVGSDRNEDAIRCAQAVYRDDERGLRFMVAAPPAALMSTAPSAVDVIFLDAVSDDAPDGGALAQAAARSLTPGGRILLAIEESRAELFAQALARQAFLIERRLPGTPAADRPALALVVAAADPLAPAPFEERTFGGRPQSRPILDFAGQYARPWLVRSMISMGMRIGPPERLAELAQRLVDHGLGGADEAAALCILAYQRLGGAIDQLWDDDLMARIGWHVREEDWAKASAIEVRWMVSLLYVRSLIELRMGYLDAARAALARCALAPVLKYSPLLATKSVDAARRLAMIHQGRGEADEALQWHRRAVENARTALCVDWQSRFGLPDEAPGFVLGELTAILDLATPSAAALALSGAQRAGLASGDISRTTFRGTIDDLAHCLRTTEARLNQAVGAWRIVQDASDFHAERADAAERRLAELNPAAEQAAAATVPADGEELNRLLQSHRELSTRLDRACADLDFQREWADGEEQRLAALRSRNADLQDRIEEVGAAWRVQKERCDRLAEDSRAPVVREAGPATRIDPGPDS